ncbi:RNA polymerase sigma factor [Streptococcus catagoni]|uniref:RNA polymerase sigma factor n=1 Tax=Streptococcus catagoni TaxID=2654874 RepID=UPI001407D021|nr:RNA polymerase sigma factor [Streptococcus catagoni]
MEKITLNNFEKELVSYANEIVAYLQKSGAPYEVARDVSQETLVKWLESDTVIAPQKVRSWMYRVAVRHYIDCYRREKKYLEILRRDFFRSNWVIEFDHPDYLPLYQAIQKLKKHHRWVLDLYYFQDFSIKEIANVLHVSQYKVKSDLYRARQKLKKELEKEGYHYEDFK